MILLLAFSDFDFEGMILILTATILGGIHIFQYLLLHNSPLLTFITGLEDMYMDRKWQKTVEIEPKITVDFNSALCHSLC